MRLVSGQKVPAKTDAERGNHRFLVGSNVCNGNKIPFIILCMSFTVPLNSLLLIF